ncbi:unnamed protein product [Allacma fusca]|uniref:Histone H4 n=1 Tax=Allacma fusca TaxID=39272 RepID=A0A8J2PK62_9HEXA|nr:unnamed protein product [Allacma fusca]
MRQYYRITKDNQWSHRKGEFCYSRKVMLEWPTSERHHKRLNILEARNLPLLLLWAPNERGFARRGKVKHISGVIYEESRGVLKVFLEKVIRDAVTYIEHAKRKKVAAMDVVYALKRKVKEELCTDSAVKHLYLLIS